MKHGLISGSSEPYSGAHGCADSENYFYMKDCQCADGSKPQRPALLNLLGDRRAGREVNMIYKILD